MLDIDYGGSIHGGLTNANPTMTPAAIPLRTGNICKWNCLLSCGIHRGIAIPVNDDANKIKMLAIFKLSPKLILELRVVTSEKYIYEKGEVRDMSSRVWMEAGLVGHLFHFTSFVEENDEVF